MRISIASQKEKRKGSRAPRRNLLCLFPFYNLDCGVLSMNTKKCGKDWKKRVQDVLDAGEKQSVESGLWKETKHPIQYITKERFSYLYCSQCKLAYSPDQISHYDYHHGKYRDTLKQQVCPRCSGKLEQKECSRQEYCQLLGHLMQQASVITDHYGVDKVTDECRVCGKRDSYIDD
ncbi:hypothetical protein A3J56_00985 [Candidatus Giovannonibacteria bacterium RIFCSPHIGHO2_02_FULL_46_20]|uniref:Uncharacterized protein n=1 Tax=Candidatus Giovannonibacteria bacterium RIFCSPHIGHO2_02_FULL_46_20 TaxID=1798338 RepID=A0A1F5WFU2_9BACT|nr:MAG: hypothetical protein A3J56_00985 [Candidatus Giovannonibacteria bacterium RIFCSPHIGHO2_02_FULL_46_20]